MKTIAKIMADLKKALRERLLQLLRSQKEEDRLKKSKVIQKKLFSTPEFKTASVVLFYASFDGEVETFSMMKQAQRLGKKIALPAIIKDRKTIVPSLVVDLKKELAEGPYGIKQPTPPWLRTLDVNQIDLAIVPGVAFDKENNRLGRGGGYYDCLLGNFPPNIPTVGLAFDFQIVDCLPHQDKRDIPVCRVIVN